MLQNPSSISLRSPCPLRLFFSSLIHLFKFLTNVRDLNKQKPRSAVTNRGLEFVLENLFYRVTEIVCPNSAEGALTVILPVVESR